MTFLSWNVNGIRAALKKGFMDSVKKENPDILCLHLHILVSRVFWTQ